MNPRRALGKLAPKVSSLTFSVAGGKQYTLLPEDVAYALAHIQDPGAGLLVEVKWSGNDRAVWPLFRTLVNATWHMANVNRWGTVPVPRIEGLAWMALLENEVVRQHGRDSHGHPHYIAGAAKCSWCKGTGIGRKQNGGMQTCELCHGSGKNPWERHPAQCAAMLGLDMSGYDDWQERIRKLRNRRHDLSQGEAEKKIGPYPAIRLWEQAWADRYKDVRALLVGWEHDALRVVKKRLR